MQRRQALDKRDFLPLGSVVSVKGAKSKIMVIGRALIVKEKPGPRYYDYAGCSWPLGQVKDSMFYFPAGVIERTYFRGYEDGPEGEEAKFQKILQETMKKVKLVRPSDTGGADTDER
jgi:hypothetical protein